MRFFGLSQLLPGPELATTRDRCRATTRDSKATKAALAKLAKAVEGVYGDLGKHLKISFALVRNDTVVKYLDWWEVRFVGTVYEDCYLTWHA